MATDIDLLLSIPNRFSTSGRTLRDLFAEAATAPVDVESIRRLAQERIAADGTIIDAWQQYSYDKRSSPSPYLDGREVGFYDGGRRHVTQHPNAAAACADFVAREAAWVIERRVVE